MYLRLSSLLLLLLLFFVLFFRAMLQMRKVENNLKNIHLYKQCTHYVYMREQCGWKISMCRTDERCDVKWWMVTWVSFLFSLFRVRSLFSFAVYNVHAVHVYENLFFFFCHDKYPMLGWCFLFSFIRLSSYNKRRKRISEEWTHEDVCSEIKVLKRRIFSSFLCRRRQAERIKRNLNYMQNTHKYI